jgi:hypothetical protein
MNDLEPDKIRSLLRIKARNSYSDSDYIESENNLLGFLETLVEIARENPEVIDREEKEDNK